jgi:hypothetical protein
LGCCMRKSMTRSMRGPRSPRSPATMISAASDCAPGARPCGRWPDRRRGRQGGDHGIDVGGVGPGRARRAIPANSSARWGGKKSRHPGGGRRGPGGGPIQIGSERLPHPAAARGGVGQGGMEKLHGLARIVKDVEKLAPLGFVEAPGEKRDSTMGRRLPLALLMTWRSLRYSPCTSLTTWTTPLGQSQPGAGGGDFGHGGIGAGELPGEGFEQRRIGRVKGNCHAGSSGRDCSGAIG